jgi:hypothetical protein
LLRAGSGHRIAATFFTESQRGDLSGGRCLVSATFFPKGLGGYATGRRRKAATFFTEGLSRHNTTGWGITALFSAG